MTGVQTCALPIFLSPQALEGDILDNDDDKEDDDNNDNNYNDDDGHFGMEYNATVYDGRENTVSAVHQARLSASPSIANVAASIAPDLSTLSRNELIAAANEAMRVQRSLEREVLQLCNKQCCQCRINHRSIAQLFQDIKKEHWLWANHWLKMNGRVSASLVLSWFITLSKKYSGRKSSSFC